AERVVRLERLHDAGDGSRRGGDGHDEAPGAERLEGQPLRAPPRHPALRDVHLHGEVDGERPERRRADEPHHGAEEREQRGRRRGHAHERRAPRQTERAHLDLGQGAHAEHPPPLAQRRAPGPRARRGAPVEEREHRLRHHLVRAYEVHHDAGVGEVEQPEGLEEPEPGEEVVRRVVPERRVPDAPAHQVHRRRRRHAHRHRFPHHLRLRRRRRHRLHREDEREAVCERDVPERLEAPPNLLHRGDAGAGADEDARDGAPDSPVRCKLDLKHGDADGGVGQRHGGGERGEPPHLVEVGDLREHDLQRAVHHHVRPARAAARLPLVVPSHVEAPRPLDRPARRPC
ncbi:Os04g0490866, partial [Oryza sativa Japonica Group]